MQSSWSSLLPAGGAKSFPKGDCYTVFEGKDESYLSTQDFTLYLGTPTFAWIFPDGTCTKTHNDSSK